LLKGMLIVENVIELRHWNGRRIGRCIRCRVYCNLHDALELIPFRSLDFRVRYVDHYAGRQSSTALSQRDHHRLNIH